MNKDGFLILTTRGATANTNRPRAWLNIIVFDEQMNMVMTNDGKNSYFEQLGYREMEFKKTGFPYHF